MTMLDEIEMDVGVRRYWNCPRCTYRIDDTEKEAKHNHKVTHEQADRGVFHTHEGDMMLRPGPPRRSGR